MARQLHALEPYAPPPSLVGRLTRPPPKERFALGVLPTPLHAWHLPAASSLGINLWIKRDDLSGCLLSGNKVRKLEFHLAAALAARSDAVLTIGGAQSNHARATAVATTVAASVPGSSVKGCHLILRTAESEVGRDPGVAGNLLPSRLAGATLHMVSKQRYAAEGGDALLASLADSLAAAGGRPHIIPLGGSDALGAWGYVEAAFELVAQTAGAPFDDIVLATGSGGTLAGLAAGLRLAGWADTRITALCVCDTPDYFYDKVDADLEALGVPEGWWPGAREALEVVQARGAGYGIARPAELDTLMAAAAATGIVLDPCYTGKALHGFLVAAAAAPARWAGRRVLFLHTGGYLGAAGSPELAARVVAAGGASALE